MGVFRVDGRDGATSEVEKEKDKEGAQKGEGKAAAVEVAAAAEKAEENATVLAEGSTEAADEAEAEAEQEQDCAAWVVQLKQLGAIWGQPISPSTRWVSWGRGTKQPLHCYIKN